MEQFIKVAGIEGKVGGYFCRLSPLNENTDNYEPTPCIENSVDPDQLASEEAS